MRRYVSGPTIANLLLQHRMSVNANMRAGKYGRTIKVGRIVYVALDEVARAEGREFSAEQIDLASAGFPDRILIVPQREEAAYGLGEAQATR
jgi:hypothetical protein